MRNGSVSVWSQCSEAQAISNAEDVIDIGIEIASTCKLTSNGLRLDNISRNHIEDLRTSFTAWPMQRTELDCSRRSRFDWEPKGSRLLRYLHS